MKKLAIGLLFFAASVARGQFTNFAHHATATAGHANGLPAASFVGPYSGTPVLGDMIVFDGSNWVSVPAGTSGQVLTEQVSLIPHWAAAGGGIVGGTCTNQLMRAIDASGNVTCSSVVNADITNATIDLTTKVTGRLPLANFDASDAIAGQALVTSASATATYADYPISGRVSFFEDFNCRPEAITRLGCGDFMVTPVGTGAGGAASAAGFALIASQADYQNMFGILELTTGTTTTGGGSVNGDTNGILLTGGETIIWRIYVPVVSGGTNTFTIYAGLCDQTGTTVGCVDGLYFTWNNNTNTHWVANTCSNSVCTNSTSSLVATAAAWHTLEIDVNAGATSIAFLVDGGALNVSPITTNIPTALGRQTGMMAKIIATAGCAAATTCVLDMDYARFSKTVSR